MPTLPETRASLIVRLPDAADALAWDEFVALYGPLVYRLARQQGLQPADADDLVQDVLAAVAKSVEQWLAQSERGPFRAWLLRIARNHSINFLTRRRHQRLGTGDSRVAWLLEQQPATGEAAASGFDLEYRREVFRQAAEQVRATVTESTWQAFWLTTVSGVPIPEAARQLSLSVGGIYIARSRVMARLRGLVRQWEESSS